MRKNEDIQLSRVSGEYAKQYSVLYYPLLKQREGVSDEVLLRAIGTNNVNWAAEHVFKVNYREYSLFLSEGRLYSPDFGDKSLHEMADDAVLLRLVAGVSVERVEAERRGIEALASTLQRLSPGQVAVIISPLVPGDPNMGKYHMVYLYEKKDDQTVRATAIRDELSSIEDLRVLAQAYSGVDRFGGFDHLDFVASPIVAKMGFDQAVSTALVSERDLLPNWVEKMSFVVAKTMLEELNRGDLVKMKEVFDAYQMIVKVRYEQERLGLIQERVVDPREVYQDYHLWMMIQRQFLMMGGREMIDNPGSCGIMDIGLREDGSFVDNNMLSGLMGIDELSRGDKKEEYSFDKDGTCRSCGKSSGEVGKLGPCYICKECDPTVTKAS